MLFLYTVTIFAGALLLFLVQPMVGRMVLPLLGGSPAVWNTAMLFYQALLLAGYAYAHCSTRWLGVRRQAAVHLAVLLLPLLVLPIGIPHGWIPPVARNPIPWLLLVMTIAVGLPFFVVSATSPLLQRWFAASGQRAAADPYFLYAASNCGSLLALVSYPLWIEPHWRLRVQSGWWAAGYGVLAVLVAGCGIWVRRQAGDVVPAAVSAAPLEKLPARRRWRWVLLALAPCSLMLSVTTYLTSELAPIPLLWVIPLGIYLLTFILVFAQHRLVPHRWMVRALPVVVAAVVVTLAARVLQPLGLLVGLHLACLFVVAMVCHGELANDRPPPAHLTEFYLWMSAGGVLGGMFNALLAPVVFTTVTEYPLTLVLAGWLVTGFPVAALEMRQRIRDVLWAVLVGLATAALTRGLRAGTVLPPVINPVIMYGLPGLFCLAFLRRPWRFALAVAAVLLAWALVPGYQDRTIRTERSFFGIHRVSIDPTQRYHLLSHGNTIHGVQSQDPARAREPLAYFTRSGPFGQVFAALDQPLKQRVGVIGLGAGSLACYAQAGQQWTFYEIDPVVEQIARDRRCFTFLPDCAGRVDVVLGDARLTLAQAADGQFGVLVLDAYNSDTVPLHLITREALALYRRKVAANGILIFHISNRHLRLERVLAALARDAVLACLAQAEVTAGLNELWVSGKIASKWMVMARDPAVFGDLARDPRWQRPPPRVTPPVWTDDYASVFSVFCW